MAANTMLSDPATESDVNRLTAELRQLENEIDRLHAAFAEQELYIIDGYLVVVQPGTVAPLIGVCPTLGGVAQGGSLDEVASELRNAMQTVIEGRTASGVPVPPRDVDAKWLA